MRSLHAQLGAILLSFLVLVTGSAAATFLSIRAQYSDALIINVAGRQRLLVQQIASDVLLVDQGQASTGDLQAVDDAFAANLAALIDGGPAEVTPDRLVELPATRDPIIRAELDEVEAAWTMFHTDVAGLLAATPGSPQASASVAALERLAPELIRRADTVVDLYEAAAAEKIARVQTIQAIFLASGLLLLVAGTWLTRRRVLNPLRDLSQAATRIGQGDLDSPVPFQGLREVAAVALSLETMRSQLRASQEALRAWAGELETRVAQRTRELVALYEVTREISSRLEINHILRSVTDKARDLLGGDVAALCLLDHSGQVLNLQSVSGPEETVAGTRLSAQAPPADQVLAADRALCCGAANCAGGCGILAAPFRIGHMAAPLRVGDRVIGSLCVGSQRAEAFPAEATSLLTKLADSVAIALENARLYEQAERVAMLEERQRIAAEMHDGVAQTLSYLDLKAQEAVELVQAGHRPEAAGVLRQVGNVITQASREARQAIAALQDGPAHRCALQAQLAELAHEPQVNGGQVTVTLPPPPLDLPPAQSEQVLRVVREALLNARRHAGAEHVALYLEQDTTEATVIVEDDGRGFDLQAPVTDGHSHFGLSIMRARAARLGGRLVVTSAPGQGTRVALSWPARGANGAARAA
ncbi:MAG: GAF domain-containing protein [Anaerolineales bacterium]|nr:GAF domain-containing protein [Anaerolineales bacterium]